jgi:predicted RNase H-like nuclease (RuvC/YqgF family)
MPSFLLSRQANRTKSERRRNSGWGLRAGDILFILKHSRGGNQCGKKLINLIHKANVNRLPGREGVSFA